MFRMSVLTPKISSAKVADFSRLKEFQFSIRVFKLCSPQNAWSRAEKDLSFLMCSYTPRSRSHSSSLAVFALTLSHEAISPISKWMLLFFSKWSMPHHWIHSPSASLPLTTSMPTAPKPTATPSFHSNSKTAFNAITELNINDSWASCTVPQSFKILFRFQFSFFYLPSFAPLLLPCLPLGCLSESFRSFPWKL